MPAAIYDHNNQHHSTVYSGGAAWLFAGTSHTYQQMELWSLPISVMIGFKYSWYVAIAGYLVMTHNQSIWGYVILWIIPLVLFYFWRGDDLVLDKILANFQHFWNQATRRSRFNPGLDSVPETWKWGQNQPNKVWIKSVKLCLVG